MYVYNIVPNRSHKALVSHWLAVFFCFNGTIIWMWLASR